jgi:hypothetical protein
MAVFKPHPHPIGSRVRDWPSGDLATVIAVGYDEDGRNTVTLDYDEPTYGVLRQSEHGFWPDELERINEPKETPPVTPVSQEANYAKLNLAVEYDLRAKFSYTNEEGRTHDVRLEPDDIWTDFRGTQYVGGDSYDEDGDVEGYKQYRVERIQDAVAIR